MSKLSKCSELLPNFHRHHCLASLKIKSVKGHSKAKERFNIIFFKAWLCVQSVTCTHVLILLFFFAFLSLEVLHILPNAVSKISYLLHLFVPFLSLQVLLLQSSPLTH